jgi:beta-fructofuranosidase
MKRRKFILSAALFPSFREALTGQESPSSFTKAPLPGKTILNQLNGDAPVRDFFYKPADAWAADFIPLYANGEFHLFFLLDWRNGDKHGEGTPWYRISTRDFVHFTEHGEMLPRGTKEEQDLYVFTGSAIKGKENYHIFYTGHNPYLAEKGKPQEGIMHAVSKDLLHWEKLRDQTFFAPKDRYETNDWRDPFVFWNDQTGEYNMLLAARFKEGIPRRRGLTALCTSKDLTTWVSAEPFYAPALYYTHECPDLFEMGGWWYLLFSEFTDKVRTRYRMSRALKGPWTAPERDDFDGHAFYAAKTASDGKKRFLFGWNPTRDGAKDTGSWDWGGNLVVHELHQQANGELSVRVPGTVKAAFSQGQSFHFTPRAGHVTGAAADTSHAGGDLRIHAPGTFGAATAGKMPGTCSLVTTIIFEKGTKSCGLILRADKDVENCYYIRFEPFNNRLVFDKWSRDRSEMTQMVELERPLTAAPGTPLTIRVLIEGNKGVAYFNDVVAMNFRVYDFSEGDWGVFVSEGTAVFKDTSLSLLQNA